MLAGKGGDACIHLGQYLKIKYILVQMTMWYNLGHCQGTEDKHAAKSIDDVRGNISSLFCR